MSSISDLLIFFLVLKKTSDNFMRESIARMKNSFFLEKNTSDMVFEPMYLKN